MIDTDKYERLTMNDMEHLELWEYSRKLFAEVKRLREAFVIAVQHVGYHHSQDDLFGVLNRLGWSDLFDLDEDYLEWSDEQ